jgi:uncharacterized protein (TIRG00374 family)
MKRYIPVVVGVLLFGLIFRTVNIPDTWVILKKADWSLLFLSVLSLVAMVYLKGIRWSFLLRMQGASYSVWNCFLIYMATLLLGNVTLGRAGDFAKVFYLKRDLRFSTGTSMASVLVDRVFDLYLLLILGCAGILSYPLPVDPALIKSVWAFFVILVAVTLLAFNKKIGGFLLKAAFQRLMKKEHRDQTDKIFEDFHKGMSAFYKPSILIPALLSLTAYLVFFEGCHMIAMSIGLTINILYLSFCVSVVNIVSLITFLGMGTREGALFILFGLISIGKDQAMAFSLLLLFIGIFIFSLLGLICFYLKPIPMGKLTEPSVPSSRASSRKNKINSRPQKSEIKNRH